MLAIVTKANLPWEAASGRWSRQAFAAYLFPRGNNRDIFFRTERREIGRQVIVSQKIQHQITRNLLGKIGTGVIKNRRQQLINIKDIQLKKIATILLQTSYFLLTTAVLLKNHEPLPGVHNIFFHRYVLHCRLYIQTNPPGAIPVGCLKEFLGVLPSMSENMQLAGKVTIEH
jgi:hypothetical protein